MNMTAYALLAFENGSEAAERPHYDSSPNGMAFIAGLWCRSHNVYPAEVKESCGYSVRVNRTLRLRIVFPGNGVEAFAETV